MDGRTASTPISALISFSLEQTRSFVSELAKKSEFESSKTQMMPGCFQLRVFVALQVEC